MGPNCTDLRPNGPVRIHLPRQTDKLLILVPYQPQFVLFIVTPPLQYTFVCQSNDVIQTDAEHYESHFGNEFFVGRDVFGVAVHLHLASVVESDDELVAAVDGGVFGV